MEQEWNRVESNGCLRGSRVHIVDATRCSRNGRPTVSTIIIGARTEQQLRDNLGSVGWSLTPEQAARLDAASEPPLLYPYWHQRGFAERNPFPTLQG